MSDDRASSSLIPLGTCVIFAKTITVAYEVAEEDVASGKTVATVTATNQDGEVFGVASHILTFLSPGACRTTEIGRSPSLAVTPPGQAADEPRRTVG